MSETERLVSCTLYPSNGQLIAKLWVKREDRVSQGQSFGYWGLNSVISDIRLLRL